MRAKRPTGVTLVEVILATSIAAIFITAFMFQYRVQQASHQIASDELRLPAQGYVAAGRTLGPEGLATGLAGTPAISMLPGFVAFPVAGAVRRIEFCESPTDPRPPGLRAGGLIARDSPPSPGNPCPTNLGPGESELSSSTLIATISFYSPELLTVTGNSGVTQDGDVSAVRVRASTSVAFYILGAAGQAALAPPDSGNTLFIVNNDSVDGTGWQFGFGAAANVNTVPFEPGGTFVLDGQGTGFGALVCAWPSQVNSQQFSLGSPATVTYTLKQTAAVRRIGFWMKLNTGPNTGTIAIRDSLTLRN